MLGYLQTRTRGCPAVQRRRVVPECSTDKEVAEDLQCELWPRLPIQHKQLQLIRIKKKAQY
jgi:hypothetical protein